MCALFRTSVGIFNESGVAAGIDGVSLGPTTASPAGSARIESETFASAERTPAHAFRA